MRVAAKRVLRRSVVCCLVAACALALAAGSSAVGQLDAITTMVGGGESIPNGSTNQEIAGSQFKVYRGLALAAEGNRIYFSSRYSIGSSPGGRVSFVNGTTGNGTGLIYGRPSSSSSASVALEGPQGLAAGTGGVLYVSDVNAVYRYNTLGGCPGCGVRVAGRATEGGLGVGGFSGDGGVATDAKLLGPSGMVVSPSGRLYIADSANNRVRYVENGNIETFAGTGTRGDTGDDGFALNAQLNNPRGLALDSVGNLYVSTKDRIRKITLSSGKISTVFKLTGTSTCPVDLKELAVDRVGNLYVSDTNRHRVWKVLPGSGVAFALMTGVCGAAGYAGDGGEVRLAKLSGPRGLAVDLQGSLHIMDVGNQRLRRVRNIPPQAGFTLSPNRTTFNAPSTVTFTPSGSYDAGGGKIIKYTWNFGAVRGSSTVKEAPVVKTFDKAGTYKVTLTVTDDSGATATASKTLTVL